MFAILIGTRPEAIKMRSVVSELSRRKLPFSVIYTGQQIDLETSFFLEFNIPVHLRLANRETFSSIAEELSRQILGINEILSNQTFTGVFVQGDTTTALAGAVSAAMLKIPVFHIEAGLRTFDNSSPFPEELNRKLIASLSSENFAPTQESKDNLIREGVSVNSIHVVGNTVVDSLRSSFSNITRHNTLSEDSNNDLKVLVSCHRRELTNLQRQALADSLVLLTDSAQNIYIDFTLHSNPFFSQMFRSTLGGRSRIQLHEGLSYSDTLNLLANASLVITDSGGLQEEAVSLGIPLLVYREKTERPECISAPNSAILKPREVEFHDELRKCLLTLSKVSKSFEIVDVVGDGFSAPRIVDIVENRYI